MRFKEDRGANGTRCEVNDSFEHRFAPLHRDSSRPLTEVEARPGEEEDVTEKLEEDFGDLLFRRRMESNRDSLEGVEGILLSNVVVVRDAADVAYVSADEILGRGI